VIIIPVMVYILEQAAADARKPVVERAIAEGPSGLRHRRKAGTLLAHRLIEPAFLFVSFHEKMPMIST
jgi:hypothetical protein